MEEHAPMMLKHEEEHEREPYMALPLPLVYVPPPQATEQNQQPQPPAAAAAAAAHAPAAHAAHAPQASCACLACLTNPLSNADNAQQLDWNVPLSDAPVRRLCTVRMMLLLLCERPRMAEPLFWRLPELAALLEAQLYSNTSSLADYADWASLGTRLKGAAARLRERGG